MTSSGAYDFNMSNSSILLESFDRIGIRQPEITRNQMQSARRSLNLELQSYMNKGPNLWEIELQSIDLEQGQSTYTLPQYIQAVYDVYIETGTGTSNPIDRILLPISRSDYASYPNKITQGPPNVYWFNRQETPILTLWTPPDGNGPYVVYYYAMRRVQDASPTMGQTPDVPYRFLDALCAGVAARLSLKFAPDKYAMLKTEAKESWAEAFYEDREMVDIHMVCDLTGYYPN